MILMDVRIDNLYAFKNFHMNMSYPKKIINSPLGNETLSGYSNFRYKKVNIIFGANASGKTSLGRALQLIFNFIDSKKPNNLFLVINDVNKETFFSIDYVTFEHKLVRVSCIINPADAGPYSASKVRVAVASEKIRTTDSYESCMKRLEARGYAFNMDYHEELSKADCLSWLFQYPNLQVSNRINMASSRSEKYTTVLENVLKALDPTILRVDKSAEVKDAYIIRTKKKDIIIQPDGISDVNYLSSGTLAGIEIADVILSIMEDYNSFYYCDEKFSYIHSDIEQAILVVMIESLHKDSQLFFTTHNTAIADLTLPKHSFTFLSKDVSDDDMPIKCISASALLKKNTDSVKHAMENDLFSTAPATDLVLDLLK